MMRQGFTLIELSIVLVIIGLITGGVLLGRDLIAAAAARAQVAQIEKFNTAVNTFRGKYGYLPGDIPDPVASQFGFAVRSWCPGTGDGNGVIEGVNQACTPIPDNDGIFVFAGETAQFWVDLSDAKLIKGGFSMPGVINTPQFSIPGTSVGRYFPAAAIGSGYVYVWSGGWQVFAGSTKGDNRNYFTLTGVIGDDAIFTAASVTPNLTVAQAYAIDSKMDDGLPQSGTVTTVIPNIQALGWAAGGTIDPVEGLLRSGDYSSATLGPITSAADIGHGTAAGPLSCYDGASGLPEKYSMNQNGGSGLNCALSFRFQ